MTAILASDIVRGLEAANVGLRGRAERAEIKARALERRVAALEVELIALKSAASLPATADVPFGLTVSENVIFTLLMSRALVTRESMQSVLYSGRPNDEPHIKIIDVFLSKLRHKLGALNFRIEYRRHTGWLITPETKNRIRNLLNQGVDDHDRNSRHIAVRPAAAPPAAVA